MAGQDSCKGSCKMNQMTSSNWRATANQLHLFLSVAMHRKMRINTLTSLNYQNPTRIRQGIRTCMAGTLSSWAKCPSELSRGHFKNYLPVESFEWLRTQPSQPITWLALWNQVNQVPTLNLNLHLTLRAHRTKCTTKCSQVTLNNWIKPAHMDVYDNESVILSVNKTLYMYLKRKNIVRDWNFTTTQTCSGCSQLCLISANNAQHR